MSPTKVLGRDGKLTLAAIVCATAISAVAETYTWAGAGSGNWSDASNWRTSGGETGVGYPKEVTDTAWIEHQSSAITITMTEDLTIKNLGLPAAPNGSTVQPVTITGSGRLTINGDGTVNSGAAARRKLRLENANVTVANVTKNTLQATANGCVEVCDGTDLLFNTIGATGSGATFRFLGGTARTLGSNYARTSNGGTIEIDGGDVRAAFTTEANSPIILKSGTMRIRFLLVNPAYFEPDRWSFQGGTLSLEANTNNLAIDVFNMWPPRGGTLNIAHKSMVLLNPLGLDNHNLATEADETYISTNFTFGGTICATNSASTEFEMRYIKGGIGGRGTLIVPTFKFVGMYCDLDLDLEALVLGKGFVYNNNRPSVRVKNGITFGAFGDWAVNEKSALTSLLLSGPVTIDTDDWFDRTTPRSITLTNLRAGTNETDIVVKGGGQASLSFNNNTGMRLKTLIVEEGATLTITNAAAHVLQVSRFVLKPNATLNLCGGSAAVIECDRSDIDPSAHINVDVPARSAATTTYAVASFGECENAEPELTAGGAGVATWELRQVGTTFFLAVPGRNVAVTKNGPHDGVATATTTDTEWTGAVDGLLSTAGNWAGNVAPSNDTSFYNYFAGWRNTVVTNDISSYASNGGVCLRLMYMLSTCGPYIYRGNPIAYAVGNNYDMSKYPTYMEMAISRTSSGINLCKTSDAHLSMLGGITVSAGTFQFVGDLRFGSTSSIVTLSPSFVSATTYPNCRCDTITVLSNGTFTISNQTTAFEKPCRLNTEPCGTLRFSAATGALLDFTAACGPNQHRTEGHLDIGIPVRVAADQKFLGDGRVDVADVCPASGTAAAVRIGGGVTLVPSGWRTASSDAADGVVSLKVESDATLAATADWAYGVESGVTATSAAADRALVVAKGATLTVDTDDPDSEGVSHTVTFADPVTGEGALTVTGGGTVAFDADVSVSSLSFEGHPSIRIGSGVAVSVAGGVDLAGVTLDADIVAGGWTTVMEADRVEGMPSVPAGRLVRVVPTSGGYALQLKRLAGLVIAIQ